MYDMKSKVAAEFISDEEIKETLAYAEKNKNNRELVASILEKAESFKGLSHREAMVLLDCELPDMTQKMFDLAMRIKQKFYGNRIVMFAPLYLSNYCVNGCLYCPYHMKNKHIPRKKLTQEEVEKEVIALQDMGHKRLAIEPGEDPVAGALRELKEETGAVPDTFLPMGVTLPSPGCLSERLYLFLARGLHMESQQLDEDEFLNVERIPFNEMVHRVMDGEIEDGKTIAAVLKAKVLLDL